MDKKKPDCVYTRETNGFGTARPFLSDVSKWQRALLLGLAVTINTECKDGQNEWRQLPSTCLVSYINGLIYSGCNNIPQPEWFLQLSKLAPRSVTQRRFSRRRRWMNRCPQQRAARHGSVIVHVSSQRHQGRGRRSLTFRLTFGSLLSWPSPYQQCLF